MTSIRSGMTSRSGVEEIGALSIPLNFVLAGSEVWPELLDGRVHDISDEDLCERCTDGPSCWILQTYVIMAQRGLAVTLSRELDPNAVNVVHPYDFGLRQRGWTAFVMSCRADGHEPRSANFRLEQSATRGSSPRHSWVPLWPQPCLVGRDPARSATIRNLVSKGDVVNLDARFRDGAFRAALGELGVELGLGTLDSCVGVTTRTSGTSARWHDYSQADLVMAVRNLTLRDAEGKRFSKLVNAWAAGVPALLGPEPAFRSIARTELDYIEVTSPDEVIAAVERLKADPGLYLRMVENGLRRAEEFSVGSILTRWMQLLNGPVRERFLAWRRMGALQRRLRIGVGVLAEASARRDHVRHIRTGPRLLDPHVNLVRQAGLPHA